MKNNIDYSCYAITSRMWHNKRSLTSLIEDAIKGGASIIQLREKEISYDEFLLLARDAKIVCRKYNVPLIINDNLDIMLKVDADGIHVGQSDIDPKIVRKLIGNDKILGVSVSNLDEAKKAVNSGANYLGVGAIFPTNTKDDANIVSIEELRNISFNIDVPVIAIGGIHLNNIYKLKNTGIKGIATISEIFKSDNIIDATKKLKNEINKIILNFNNYDLLVFDYDGTLLNSMFEWRHIASLFVKSKGIKPSDDLDYLIRKMNSTEAANYIYQNYHIGKNFKECDEMIFDFICETYKDLKLKDNAYNLLTMLHNLNKEMIILSQTNIELLEISLKNNNIYHLFNKVYDTFMLNSTKSDGSAFKRVIELYKNKKILIVEDSLYAINECKKLGLDVLTIIDDENLKHTKELLEISNYYGDLRWCL